MPLGIPPANINNLEYAGQPLAIVPVVDAQRNPLLTDVNYPLFCLWRNTVNFNAYILVGFSAGQALWRLFQFGSSTGTIDFLTGNIGGPVGPDPLSNVNIIGDGITISVDGTLAPNTLTISSIGSPSSQTTTVQQATAPGVVVVTPLANNINVNGAAVAGHSVPIETRSRALHAYNVEVQYGGSAGAATATQSGLVHFNNTQFTVDNTTGFVSLLGSSPAIEKFTVQQASAPGVNPVVPNSGVVTINGAAVAAHSTPVETRTRAVSAYNVEVQYASAVAATDATQSGLAHFNNTQFTVDANGFVNLIGSSAALEKIAVDAATGPGTNPVLPNAGQITVTGGQVAAGTTTNVIRTNSLAANTYTIQIQRSTTAGSSTVGSNGVCHFNSAEFTVDSNGFVSLTSNEIFTWQTISANQTLVAFNGYICISPGGALALALPSTGSTTIGNIIEIVLDGATSFQITQAASQQISIGNLQTTAGAGGSITSSGIGCTIRMVAQSSTRWNVLSSIGNFVVV